MIETTSLDTYQRAVVNSSASSIRVVAPAGSGKTEALSIRVQRRIRDGVDPRRILLLTFDNNARNAIVGRLERLGVPGGVHVSTLNAFGYQLLNTRFTDERRRIVRDVFFPNSQMLNDLVKEYGHSVFTEMLGKIKNEAIDTRTIDQTELARWCAKNQQHLLRNLEDDPILANVTDTRFGRELAREMSHYEQFLEQKQGIDFDDQKLRPLVRLKDDSNALDWLQSRFDDVIVDEFQDINRLDVMLINLIAAKSNLLITGDDDQAIYGFRGATADFLIHPRRELHREFEEFELSINYRCPPSILNVASNLIAYNTNRIDKQPRASKQIPGEVEVHGADSIDAESTWIARRMKAVLAETPGTTVVLARRRAQLVGIQAACIRAGTPYRVSQPEDIRISWGLARRALALAPLSLRGMPDEETRAEIIGIFAQARAMTPQRTSALVRLARLDDHSFPGPELLQQLFERDQRSLTDGIKALTGEVPLTTRLRSLDALLNTEMRTFMEGGKDAARERADKDTSRLSGLVDLAQDSGLNTKRMIERIEQLLAPQRAVFVSDIPAVELSTCHGSKGREWQTVCIPHCNQGVFPDSRSDTGEHLEAERKLFYVSMTRASERLLMTWSKDFTRGAKGEPSDFLIEASVVQPRKKQRLTGVRARRINEADEQPATVANRSLAPNGSWVMAAKPKKITGPTPRYLTMVTPRTRTMQNAIEISASRTLADAIEMQHDDHNIEHDAISVRYPRSDVFSTVPLQVELAIRGTPFAIDEAARFLESSLYQEILRAWSADATAQVKPKDSPLVDAIAAVLERLTESDDAWLWLDRLEKLEGADIGTNPDGVQFVPQ